MKISKRQLKRIIKEEKAKLVKEQDSGRLPEEMYDLEREISDFIILVDRFFASGKVNRYLEPAGLLDDPDSWAIELEELRYDLGQIQNKMMGGQRKIR